MSVAKKTTSKISYSLLILVLVFEVIFIKLAYWQYGRMNEKESAFKAFSEQLNQKAVPFDKNVELKDWKVVTISGVFDYENEKLLQNRHYKTYVGYRVITPLMTDDGDYVMVDRGWIPKSWDRENPEVLEDKKGQVTFTGVVRNIPPKKTFIEGPLYGVTKRVIKRLDSTAFPMVSEYKNLLIQATSSNNQNIRSFVEKPHTGSRHSEYMLTWICMALILPSLYISFIYIRRKKRR